MQQTLADYPKILKQFSEILPQDLFPDAVAAFHTLGLKINHTDNSCYLKIFDIIYAIQIFSLTFLKT